MKDTYTFGEKSSLTDEQIEIVVEKMAKEMGLSKSAMISVALENYKKGQEK